MVTIFMGEQPLWQRGDEELILFKCARVARQCQSCGLFSSIVVSPYELAEAISVVIAKLSRRDETEKVVCPPLGMDSAAVRSVGTPLSFLLPVTGPKLEHGWMDSDGANRVFRPL